MAAPDEESNPIFPMTLDLRLPAARTEGSSETPGLAP
jgi:hypothetical protein